VYAGRKIVFLHWNLLFAKEKPGVAGCYGMRLLNALADHGAQRMKCRSFQQLGAVAGNVLIKDQTNLKHL